ncbi:hypothetical protein APHAL10511_003749 [Amanita phalloides]|nr:hypothetical protein APHAL10511_003749 [Amanita phalloides]
MSLKVELEAWAAALKAYDEEDFDKALELFSQIADSSKILTNMGLIYATLGEHESAIEKFAEAVSLDQYLAIAYFQCGVSNFLISQFDLALENFEDALLYLRGNQNINYEQLGLNFQLHAAEILFNKGICLIYMDRVQEGLESMQEASGLKVTEQHDVIDEAIRDKGDGYTVFSVPVGVIYRPSEKKLKNAMTKDYLGKAKLVAASDPIDVYTEFSGVTRLKQGISPGGIFIDRPDINPVPVSLARSTTTATFKRTGEFRALPHAWEADQQPDTDSVPKTAAIVDRSKTILNVPSNFRERTSGKSNPSNDSASNAPTLSRSNTVSADRSNGLASLARGPSKRIPPPVFDILPIHESTPSTSNKDKRVTELYDGYLDSYGDTESTPGPAISPAPPVPASNNYRFNRNSGRQRDSTMSRMSGLRSAPVGGSQTRKSTRRSTRGHLRAYEEEEEGYGSGDYEEAPFDIQKIRIKIHYNEDVRGMAIPADTTFAEFMDKLTSKFERSLTGLSIKFKDEDGGQVSLRDESDFELAVETAREAAQGKSEVYLSFTLTQHCYLRAQLMGLAGRKIKQRIGADPRNLSWADDASRFGSAYLAKFGWDSGKGLGVEGDGRTSHIKVAHKLDMLGIGAANVHDPDGIAWKQNRDFENLLRRLNEAANSEEEDEGTKVEGFVSEGKGGESEEVADGVEEKSEKKKKRKEKAKKDDAKKKKDNKQEIIEEEDSEPGDGKNRKQKDEEHKSKKRKTNEFTQSTIPRHRAHRARAIAAKKMISNSTTAISEILGIAPSSSSLLTQSTTPDDDTTTADKITKSTKSVADYFKERLQSQSSGSSRSSTPSGGNPELNADAYCTPRRGLGSGLSSWK